MRFIINNVYKTKQNNTFKMYNHTHFLQSKFLFHQIISIYHILKFLKINAHAHNKHTYIYEKKSRIILVKFSRYYIYIYMSLS